MRSHWIPSLVIVGLIIAFRCLSAAGSMSDSYANYFANFSPLPALFLCSIVFLRGKKAWLLPIGAWLITDPVVSLLQGYGFLGWHHLSIALGLAGAAAIGLLLRKSPSNLAVMGGALGSALLFYFTTNMVSFIGDPLYPKTMAGFIQAQWTGPEAAGYSLPTWVFLRNLTAANLLFTGLFLIAQHCWAPSKLPATATQAR